MADFPTTSPILDADIIKELNFTDAIREILDHKKVTRREWGEKRTYFLLKEGILQIHKAGEAEKDTHPVILNDGDLIGEDYIVL